MGKPSYWWMRGKFIFHCRRLLFAPVSLRFENVSEEIFVDDGGESSPPHCSATSDLFSVSVSTSIWLSLFRMT